MWARDPGSFHVVIPPSLKDSEFFESRQKMRMENPHMFLKSLDLKVNPWDFSGGPVVKNLPSSARDAGSIPGWGTNIPHASGQLSPQLLSLRASVREPVCHKLQSLRALDPACHNYRAHAPWSPCTTTREKPAHLNEGPACRNYDLSHN